MARKKKETEAVEAVAEEIMEKPEPIENKDENPKQKIIIAKMPVPFRRRPNLNRDSIVGQMPVGTAYKIVKEVKSSILGDFYLLNNGYYITKGGNYTIM